MGYYRDGSYHTGEEPVKVVEDNRAPVAKAFDLVSEAEQTKIEEKIKGRRIIGYTKDRVWVPLKNKAAFFGGIAGMLLSVPFTLDQLHIFEMLHTASPFATGWSAPLNGFIWGIVGILGLLLFLMSITQTEHLPVQITKDEEDLQEERLKGLKSYMVENEVQARAIIEKSIEQAKAGMIDGNRVEAMITEAIKNQPGPNILGSYHPPADGELMEKISAMIEEAEAARIAEEKPVETETVKAEDACLSGDCSIIDAEVESAKTTTQSPTKKGRGRHKKRASP